MDDINQLLSYSIAIKETEDFDITINRRAIVTIAASAACRSLIHIIWFKLKWNCYRPLIIISVSLCRHNAKELLHKFSFPPFFKTQAQLISIFFTAQSYSCRSAESFRAIAGVINSIQIQCLVKKGRR